MTTMIYHMFCQGPGFGVSPWSWEVLLSTVLRSSSLSCEVYTTLVAHTKKPWQWRRVKYDDAGNDADYDDGYHYQKCYHHLCDGHTYHDLYHQYCEYNHNDDEHNDEHDEAHADDDDYDDDDDDDDDMVL